MIDLHKFLKMYVSEENGPVLSPVWMTDFTDVVLNVPCVFNFQIGISFSAVKEGVNKVDLRTSHKVDSQLRRGLLG